MYFERYLFRTLDNSLTSVFSLYDVTCFEDKNIFGETIKVYNETPIIRETTNSTYQNLITIFSKPTLVHDQVFPLLKFRLIYVKTNETQAILNINNWNQTGELNLDEGTGAFLDIYCVLYDNVIKFAVQNVYQSVPKETIFTLLKLVVEKSFLNSEVLEEITNENSELVHDFSENDFSQIFTTSKRQKQVNFKIDTTIEGNENINSATIKYSIKGSTNYPTISDFIQSKISSDGITRYTLKCEDNNGRIASFDGVTISELEAQHWSNVARVFIDEPIDITQIRHFLRIQ